MTETEKKNRAVEAGHEKTSRTGEAAGRTEVSRTEVLAGERAPVTYLGFQESEQNRLKLLGFRAGCDRFHVEVEK